MKTIYDSAITVPPYVASEPLAAQNVTFVLHMYTQQQLRSLDLPTLSELYRKQVEVLNAQLLAGVDWADLNELRGYITQIGVAIDVKLAEKGAANVG